MSARTKKKNPRRPYVFMNMAMTADGKIATANSAVSSFGSARDLEHLYELRTTADAVMCGARTVEISGTVMGTGGAKFRRQRLNNGLAEYHLRILVSGHGSVDLEAEIFKHDVSPIIVLTTERIPQKKLKALRELADEVMICGKDGVDLKVALRHLQKQWGVKRLLCEGGGELNDSMFRADLVDEINLTLCPKIFGGRAAPTISEGEGFPRLALTRQFEFHSVRAIKGELFTVLLRAKKGHSA